MNQSSSTKQLINKIGKFLKNQPVQKAWLFGSFAREEATKDSDVDLLVQLDYQQIITGLEYFQLWEQLEKLVQRKVDLVSEGKLSKYVLPRVEKEKILIYEQGKA